jgi:hypothetical protein
VLVTAQEANNCVDNDQVLPARKGSQRRTSKEIVVLLSDARGKFQTLTHEKLTRDFKFNFQMTKDPILRSVIFYLS